MWGGLAVSSVMTILLGLFPSALIELAGRAAGTLIPN
jgi:hypothetical protein